jgi:hypothetical protein
MTDKMIACCGLDCGACSAYLAWKNDNQALREKTAIEWKKAFSFDFTPAMINCSGCRVPGEPKVGHCSECQMRACAMGKGHDTCADCADFTTCGTIQDFIKNCPPAGATLARLRT